MKADVWRHQRSCLLNPRGNESKAIGKAKRIAPATAGKLLLPTKTRNVDANVVLPMKNDDVKSTIEMDPIIMAYGDGCIQNMATKITTAITSATTVCKTYSQHEEDHRYQGKPRILHHAMQLGGAA